MKALVLGGTGRIGSAVAWDLARYGGADVVGIAGRSSSSLQKTIEWIGSEKVQAHLINIYNHRESRKLMKE